MFDGDITGCSDETDDMAVIGRFRRRVGDTRVRGLAIRKVGPLAAAANTARPILDGPTLDEHFVAKWGALGLE